MTVSRRVATLQAATNAITARVDSGSGPGKFRLFSGGLSGTLIGEATCADPAYATAGTDGDAELASPATGTAIAAGDANAYVLTNSANNQIESGNTTTDLVPEDGVHFEIGDPITISSYIINASKAVTP
jgi:hypothetical protein